MSKTSTRLSSYVRSPFTVLKLRKTFFLFVAIVGLSITAVYSFGDSAGSIRDVIFGKSAGVLGMFADSSSATARQSANGAEFEAETTMPLVQLNGNLMLARTGHTATALGDGRVLVVGGESTGANEIFDPATAVSSSTGNLNSPRTGHTATRLSDGRVLIAGGSGANNSPLASTEIYDPANGTFAVGPPMVAARFGHTATALGGGKILITGGDAAASAEIYDTAAHSFSSVSGTMTASRVHHSAVALNDGRVFIAGGTGMNSAEIFDPATGQFTAAGNAMTIARAGALLRVLFDGKVQIIGGSNDGSMEVYDPAIDTVGAYAHVKPDTDTCAGLSAALLASPTRSALFHNGQADTLLDRTGQTITEIAGNKAVVIGGTNSGETALDTLSVLDSSPSSISTDKLDYAPGETATIKGTGFQPGEIVSVKIHEDPHTPQERGLVEGNPVADSNGNFSGTYPVMDYDLNMHFIVGARGLTSGTTAQTTFTDATHIQTVTVIGAQTPNPVIAGNAVTYGTTASTSVRVEFNGNGSGSCTVSLGAVGLPAGATATFSPSTLAGPGATKQLFTLLTINTTAATPGGTSTFMVKATGTGGAGNDCATSESTSSASVSLVVAGVTSTTTAANDATATYGDTSVNLSATVTPNTVSTGTVTFTIKQGTTVIGSATASGTVSSGNASVSYALPSGTAAATYSVEATYNGGTGFSASTDPTPGTLTIGKKSVSPAVAVANKVYDATSAATIVTRTLTSVLASDTANVTLTGGTATFSAKDVGTAKTVTATGLTLSGTASANYVLSSTSATTTADITPKALSVSELTASNKIYDATLTASITGTATLEAAIAPGSGTSGDGKPYTGDAAVLGGTPAGTFASKDVANGIAVTVTGVNVTSSPDGNYTVTQPTGLTANITQKALTVTGLTASNKVYDGTTTATLGGTAALLGSEDPGSGTNADGKPYTGDTVTIGGTPVGTFATKNAGTAITITVTGSTIGGTHAGNYSLSQQSGLSADITPKNLTINGASAVSREYDATTVATVNFSGALPVGVIGSENVTINSTNYTASFADKTVGTAKAVTVSGVTLGGTDAANYTVSQPSGLTADITAKHLTGSFTTQSKEYDGGKSAVVLTRSLAGVIAGDTVTLTGGTAEFADKNAGTAKVVALSGAALAGADFGNYILDSVATALADITARAITVTAATNSREYDGTTNAAATPTITAGTMAGGDTASFTESYTTKIAGTGKTLVPAGTVTDGNGGNNYAVTFQNNLTGVITAKPLTATAVGENKVYDGNTNATVTISVPEGIVSGDVVTVSYSPATFDTKNVGSGKTISVGGISLGGADAANYSSNTTATTNADITQRSLTVTATGINREYDRTTTATVTLADDRVAGDLISAAYSGASFLDKTVGTDKTVNVTGISISGADAPNYSLSNTTVATTANITPKALTASIVANDKIYDGNATATFTCSLAGVIGTDAVACTGGTAAFNTRNVGTGKVVTASNLLISGDDAGNYTVNTTATDNADITALGVTGSFTAENKVYDRTTAAVVLTRSPGSIIAGDVVSLVGGTASFSDKTAANGKTVTLSGAALDGTDAANYVLDSVSTTTADITKRDLHVTATGLNKQYDGNANATATLSDDRVGGDELTAAYTSATFNNKSVAAAKPITINGISISGLDAGNYNLANTTASATADITALHVTGSFTASDKPYDGNTDATVVTRSPGAIIALDNVFLTGGTAAFDTRNVGMGKVVTLAGASLTGTDAGNYFLDSVSTTTASISAIALTANVTAVNKIYDGTDGVTITACTFSGVIAGDVVACSITGYAAHFTDKNVNTSKSVSASGLTALGADKDNYTFTGTGTGTADIEPLALAATVTAISKTYDALTAAYISGCAFTNFIINDDIHCDATNYEAAFASKNVATGIPVSAAHLVKTGVDAPNYTFDGNGSGTADITKATPVITVTGGTFTYNGLPHAAAASASGVPTEPTVTGTFAITYTPPGSNAVPVNAGTYAVNASFTSADPNYTDAGNTGAILINKANADCSSIMGVTVTYDGNAHSASGQCNGVDGNPLAGLDLGASFTNFPGGMANWTFAGSTNYNDQSGTAPIVINKAVVTITASSHTVTYGDAAPMVVPSYSGFVGSQGASVLTTAPACTTTYTSASPVAVYQTACSGSTAANYDFNYVAGSVSVEKAPTTTTLTFASGPYVYRGTAFTADSTVTGPNGLNQSLTVTYSGDCTNATGPDGCTAAASYAETANYLGSSDSKSITIAKAASATVVTCPTSVTYTGAALTPCTVSVTGANLSQTPAPNYANNLNAGTATASYTYVPDANHTGSSDSKNFDIAKKLVTVTPNPQTITYGASDPTFSFTYDGFAGTEGPGNLASQASCTVSGPSPHGAGTYTITCTAGAAANYSFNVAPTAVFTVNQAPLVVTASSHAVLFMAPTPTITASYSGFVLGQGAASLSTQPTCSTTYTSGSGVSGSPYPTTCVGAASSNYAINYVAGSVTLTGYSFDGFKSPIEMTTNPVARVWNKANGGQAIPAKWRLTLNGVPMSALSTFVNLYSYQVSCATGTSDTEHPIIDTGEAPGNSDLTYQGDGNFQFNWKTPKSYVNQCRIMYVQFLDGSQSPPTYFKFK